jgi:hypothetical protein
MNSALLFKVAHKSGRPHRSVLALLGGALLLFVTGCTGDMPHRGSWAAPTNQGKERATSSAAQDYLYYPAYGVYFNADRQNYTFLQSDGWVTRPRPNGVSIADLLASPRVRLNFSDGPEQHHLSVVRNYPKNWPGTGIASVTDLGY